MSKKTDTKTASKTVAPLAMPAAGSMHIPLGRIIVDPEFNIRQTADEHKVKELAKSIESDGQIQDVIVEPREDGNYFLIAGYRRLAAFHLLLATVSDNRKKSYETIRASLWQPTDAKGNALTDTKEIAMSRYFVNMAENVQRSDINTYDLAVRMKYLKDTFDLDGGKIGSRLGKSTPYVNNLLAIMGGGEKGKHAGNTLHPVILAKWKEECARPEDDLQMKICKTNWLRHLVTLDHATQLARFNRELWMAENPGVDPIEYDKTLGGGGTSGAGAGAGGGSGGGTDAGDIIRATKAQLIAALEAAERAKTKKNAVRINGIIDGLKFALGVKKGLANRIKDVCAFKDGEMIEGAPKEEKEAPKTN